MHVVFPCGYKLQTVLMTTVVTGTLLVMAGCRSSGPPYPPRPWPTVNAALPDHWPWYFDRVAAGDTRVVASLRGCDEFWKRTRGDWQYSWIVARFEVVTVEQGSWPNPTLVFVCWDSWPTLESGIKVHKPLWPYRQGVILAFDLDTKQQPARVVGQVVRHDPDRVPVTQEAAP